MASQNPSPAPLSEVFSNRSEPASDGQSRPLKKSRGLWWLFLLLVVGIAGVLAAILSVAGKKEAAAPAPAAPLQNVGVAAQGRVEPEDGVIQVAAPYYAGRPSVVRELRVREGDWVRAGQILAVLDGFGPAEAALRQNEARVTVARARLQQVKAGEKAGEIAAQRADMARKESELENAEAEYRRFEKLHQARDVSASQLDEKRMLREAARRSLEWSKEKLKSLSEVRQIDVDLAASEVEAALAEVQRARADLELTSVRAPLSGRVLKIHARPGEQAGSATPQNPGILELGKTDRMYVVAEVYETDVRRIRAGQTATISSDLFPGQLQGTVTEVGMKVKKREVLPLDPATFADARVVEVKVRLEESKPVAGLIHGRVNVRIHP